MLLHETYFQGMLYSETNITFYFDTYAKMAQVQNNFF